MPEVNRPDYLNEEDIRRITDFLRQVEAEGRGKTRDDPPRDVYLPAEAEVRRLVEEANATIDELGGQLSPKLQKQHAKIDYSVPFTAEHSAAPGYGITNQRFNEETKKWEDFDKKSDDYRAYSRFTGSGYHGHSDLTERPTTWISPELFMGGSEKSMYPEQRTLDIEGETPLDTESVREFPRQHSQQASVQGITGQELRGRGSAFAVTAHETFGHWLDDALVGTVGDHERWSNTEDGKRILDMNPESYEGRGEFKGHFADRGERFAGFMRRIMDTNIFPEEFNIRLSKGGTFFDMLKKALPNLRMMDLGLKDAENRENLSPWTIYREVDADPNASEEDKLIARARAMNTNDPRDQKPGDVQHTLTWNPNPWEAMDAESLQWNDPTGPGGEYGQAPVVPPMRPPRDFDSGNYTIRPGDSLSELSKRFNISVGDLKTNIWPGEQTGERQRDPNNPDKIYAGDIIVFPPASEQSWYLDKSDPSVIGEFGEIQQGDPRRLEYAESEGQDWVKQEMDVEQLHRLMQAWEDQQKAGVGKGFLDRLKSDPGFYMEVPPGADYDPGFTMQPPPGGWPDYDPGFYIK